MLLSLIWDEALQKVTEIVHIKLRSNLRNASRQNVWETIQIRSNLGRSTSGEAREMYPDVKRSGIPVGIIPVAFR